MVDDLVRDDPQFTLIGTSREVEPGRVILLPPEQSLREPSAGRPPDEPGASNA